MNFDIALVGMGIVGLSTALELKNVHPDISIVIIDKEKDIALHQSGNNSGVIHSGIYYKSGSAKAENCLEGYSKMITYCEEKQIDYSLCGKLIIAKNESEVTELNNIYDRGIEKGMKNLEIIDGKQIKEIEPHVTGYKAIRVPQAGIVDYKRVSLKIQEDLKDKGVTFLYNTKVLGIKIGKDIQIKTSKESVNSKFIVNCAGLYSDRLAKLSGCNINYKILPFRGEYYQLKKELNHLVKGLIYPVPDPNFPFLGIHLTKKMDNCIEAGPNAVLAFRREGYKLSDVNFSELGETLRYSGFQKLVSKYASVGIKELRRSMSKRTFLKELQSFIPSLSLNDFKYRGAGVRAQACDPEGNLIDDFMIQSEGNVVNVCNAPSPAATSCFAIAENIVKNFVKLK
ncbi:MAG: L-2-hydroxyglutarate oxidase [Saprospiraceae bacterium]